MTLNHAIKLYIWQHNGRFSSPLSVQIKLFHELVIELGNYNQKVVHFGESLVNSSQNAEASICASALHLPPQKSYSSVWHLHNVLHTHTH